MPSENYPGTSNGYSSGTLLDNTILVYQVPESVVRPTLGISSLQECTVSSNEGEYSHSMPQTTSSDMQSIREQFIKCSILGEIANVLMCSWRLGTQKYTMFTSKSGVNFVFNKRLIHGNQV